MQKSPSLLFVCLGNICRSPAAQGIFRDLAASEGFECTTDSAGTGGWHKGNPPDRRMIEAASERGIDISDLRARQVDVGDFYAFDYILAMDQSNFADLSDLAPRDATAKLTMMLDHGAGGDVPDPYYDGDDGFQHVLDLLQAACAGLMDEVSKEA